MIMTLIRVAYGKPTTPIEDREYQIDGTGPVGTLAEYRLAYPGQIFKLVERRD